MAKKSKVYRFRFKLTSPGEATVEAQNQQEARSLLSMEIPGFFTKETLFHSGKVDAAVSSPRVTEICLRRS